MKLAMVFRHSLQMTLRPIFFDLETTGISTRSDRIIEIGAFDPYNQKCFESFICPQMPIAKESTAINGITDAMVAHAPPFHEVAAEFLKFCDGDVVLIAHNGIFFDFPFLNFELKRVGLSYPEHWYGVDSLVWARKYRKDLPRHSLQYLRQIFNIPENTAHRAMDDTKVLASLFSLMTDDLTSEEIIERGDGKKLVELVREPSELKSKVETAPTFFSL